MLKQLFLSIALALATLTPINIAAQDLTATMEKIRIKAEEGNAKAQCDLGYMYNVGIRVEQNYEEAVKWYRKAAVQGNADAQFNLGVMYDNGTGVEQDTDEAIRWFRRAARKGVEDAAIRLRDLGVSR